MIRCPTCATRHDRGPVNGVDGYRCLVCGESFQGDRARIVSLIAELGRGAPIEIDETDETDGRHPGSINIAIRRGEQLVRIEKHLTYFDQHARHSCDAKCSKAWGINSRPRVMLGSIIQSGPYAGEINPDDYFYYADDELGDAPDDPGSYEGGHAKPTEVTGPESINKWCVRECERGRLSAPGRPYDETALPDLSRRLYNIPSSQGRTPS